VGVNVQWDNLEKTIIRYDFSGRWTWDEFYAAYEIAKAMLIGTTQKVYFIMNSTDEVSRKYTPPNALTHMISIGRKAVPNAGKVISVSGNAFTRVLFQMVSKVNPKLVDSYAFASTLEEARAMVVKESVGS
jgi:hypothetical protein